MLAHVVKTIIPKIWPTNHKRRDQNLRKKNQKHMLLYAPDKN